jgi:hypothetical protein
MPPSLSRSPSRFFPLTMSVCCALDVCHRRPNQLRPHHSNTRHIARLLVQGARLLLSTGQTSTRTCSSSQCVCGGGGGCVLAARLLPKRRTATTSKLLSSFIMKPGSVYVIYRVRPGMVALLLMYRVSSYYSTITALLLLYYYLPLYASVQKIPNFLYPLEF